MRTQFTNLKKFSNSSCAAGLALSPLTAEDIRKNSVQFSLSRAYRLGHAVKLAQKEKRSPVQALLQSQNGKLLISGKVCVIKCKRIFMVGFCKNSCIVISLFIETLFQRANICEVRQKCTYGQIMFKCTWITLNWVCFTILYEQETYILTKKTAE